MGNSVASGDHHNRGNDRDRVLDSRHSLQTTSTASPSSTYTSPSSSSTNASLSSGVTNNYDAMQQFPDLVILKDVSCQTTTTGSGEVGPRGKGSKPNWTTRFLFLVLIYVAFITAAITSPTLQSVLVYLHLVKYPFGDLKDLKSFNIAEARNIEITTDDGVTLYGYHYLPPGADALYAASITNETEKNAFFNKKMATADRIFIYFHGNCCNRALHYRIWAAKNLAGHFGNSHVVTIDYRGFGDSTGWPSEQGTGQDARAVVQWVDKVVKENNALSSKGYLGDLDLQKIFVQATDASDLSIVTSSLQNNNVSNVQEMECVSISTSSPHLYLYGHSLGSGVSVALANDLNNVAPGAITGVILDSPFTSLVQASLTHPIGTPFRVMPKLESLMKKYLRYQYPSIERISSIGTNLLIVHGTKDSKIPVEHAKALHRTALAGEHSSSKGKGGGVGVGVGVGGEQMTIQLQIVADMGHSTVHRSPEWLTALSSFLEKAEAKGRRSGGTCRK